MPRAANLGEPLAAALADRIATVTADVLERAQLAVVAAHDQHGVRTGAVLEVVAGLGDVIDGARDLPHVRPETLLFERGEVG